MLNKSKIEKLNKNIIPIYEPGLEELTLRNKKEKRIVFTTELKESIKKSEIIFICVGDPTKRERRG